MNSALRIAIISVALELLVGVWGGGGVCCDFKECVFMQASSYKCLLVISFEALVCEGDLSEPLRCALIYRAPKSNKDFFNRVLSFLSILATKADNFLLLGDFNVHVC